MRTIAVLLAFGCFSAGAAPTLCRSPESVVFSCEVGRAHKVVSLCASAGRSSDRAALAYRFGQPDHVELEFPRRGTRLSARAFRFTHYFRHQVDRAEVTFNLGEYSYTVFSYFDGEEKPETSQGVRVSRGKKQTILACASEATANFAALETAIPCDSENALATCR